MAGDLKYVADGMLLLEDILIWSRTNPGKGDELCRADMIAKGWPEDLVNNVMMLTEDLLVKLYDLSKERQ